MLSKNPKGCISCGTCDAIIPGLTKHFENYGYVGISLTNLLIHEKQLDQVISQCNPRVLVFSDFIRPI